MQKRLSIFRVQRETNNQEKIKPLLNDVSILHFDLMFIPANQQLDPEV